MIRVASVVIAALLLSGPALADGSANVSAGVERWRAGDWDGAVSRWQGPASRGDADAMFNMGQAYRLGRGVPRDNAQAIEYYRRAADKGHVAAMANLGITLFQDGRRAEAMVHLRQAADRGDTRATYVMGIATFNGDGAARNPVLGYAYMIRAREGGMPQADKQAARMATLLTEAERARSEAAAAALAAGEPVPVELVGGRVPPATPAPAPTPTPVSTAEAAPVEEAAPAAAETESRWRVQLGAYASEQAARTAWATLVAQSAGILEGQRPSYSPRAGLVRLQVGPFAGADEARALCQRLSAAGRPCFITRN